MAPATSRQGNFLHNPSSNRRWSACAAAQRKNPFLRPRLFPHPAIFLWPLRKARRKYSSSCPFKEMGQFFRRKADDNRPAMRADVRFFRVEQIIQELLHLANIKLVTGLYGAVAREICQGAMAGPWPYRALSGRCRSWQISFNRSAMSLLCRSQGTSSIRRVDGPASE